MSRIHRHAHVLALVALATLITAGCGDAGGSGGSGASASPTPTTTESASSPTSSPTTPPSEALQKLRVVGQVVETGECVVVRDDNDITWTITGERASDLVLNDRVQVSGKPDIRAEGCGGPLVRAVSVRVLPPTE